MTQTLLITGVSGYIGSWVSKYFLDAGYKIHATVRSQAKLDELKANFSKYSKDIQFFIVDDISKEGVYNDSIKGVDGIIHVASPIVPDGSDVEKDYVLPAVNGTVNILNHALKVPSVKRVVITSSVAAIKNLLQPSGYYTEKDWNPSTIELAKENPQLLAYPVSKTLAEKAAWKFLEEKKPHFDIVAINPSMVFGPNLFPSKLTSMGLLEVYLSGKVAKIPPSFVFVDVRDVAKVHVLAYENPKASNQRYIASPHTLDYNEFSEFVHKEFPGQTKAPKDDGSRTPAPHYCDSSKSIAELGITYIDKETTLRESVAQIISNF